MGDDWGMSDEVDVFAIALEIAQLIYSKCSTAEDVTKVLEEAKNILQLSYSGIALSGVACYSVLLIREGKLMFCLLESLHT